MAPDIRNTHWLTQHSPPCALGESPFWHPVEQKLYWVDIAGQQILRASGDLHSVETWDMPSEPGCIAPAARGGLVMALRHGIFRADRWGGPLRQIGALPYDPGRMRANDGKCDAQGRFWVGTIDESRSVRDAALFCIDARGGIAPTITRKLGPPEQAATTANGLAWSPDQHTLYWADTPSHTVWAWDFDSATTAMTTQRVFARFAAKPEGWVADPQRSDNGGYQGRPDGAAVDQQGNYWVALYEGRRICQFAPDGRLLQTIDTPLQCPTMPCFGGADLQTLYITSVRKQRNDAELAAYAQSGCVLARRVTVPGLPVACFQD